MGFNLGGVNSGFKKCMTASLGVVDFAYLSLVQWVSYFLGHLWADVASLLRKAFKLVYNGSNLPKRNPSFRHLLALGEWKQL